MLELDRKVGEAIDIYVNDRLVARGEVVLVEEKLGVTMTEIIKAERNWWRLANGEWGTTACGYFHSPLVGTLNDRHRSNRGEERMTRCVC